MSVSNISTVKASEIDLKEKVVAIERVAKVVKGVTIAAASSTELGKKSVNIENSKNVGKKLAEKAIASGVKEIVFDRNGYLYHGNVKAFAEGAREGGLKF